MGKRGLGGGGFYPGNSGEGLLPGPTSALPQGVGCLQHRPLHPTPLTRGCFLPQSFLPSAEKGFPCSEPLYPDPGASQTWRHRTWCLSEGCSTPRARKGTCTQHPDSLPRDLVNAQKSEFWHQYALSQALPTVVSLFSGACLYPTSPRSLEDAPRCSSPPQTAAGAGAGY